MTTRLVRAQPDCRQDPRACFDGFDDNGTIKPKDPQVAKTFNFPVIKAGFIVDVRRWDILPHIAIELVDFTVPRVGDFSVDAGIAASRVFGVFSWELIPLIKAGPSLWFGYNVKEKEYAFGVGVSLLDF